MYSKQALEQNSVASTTAVCIVNRIKNASTITADGAALSHNHAETIENVVRIFLLWIVLVDGITVAVHITHQ